MSKKYDSDIMDAIEFLSKSFDGDEIMCTNRNKINALLKELQNLRNKKRRKQTQFIVSIVETRMSGPENTTLYVGNDSKLAVERFMEMFDWIDDYCIDYLNPIIDDDREHLNGLELKGYLLHKVTKAIADKKSFDINMYDLIDDVEYPTTFFFEIKEDA